MNAPVPAPLLTMATALEPTADPAWVIGQHGFDPLRDSSRQSRFSISNGFLGVRGNRAINRGAKADVPPRTYVAGLFDIRGAEQPIPALVPVADWLRVNILLPGAASELNPEDVSDHYRTLDMRRGTLLTGGSLVGIPGLVIHLRVLRLVSLHERSIGLQLIELEVEQGVVDITFEASFDGLDFGLKAGRLEQDAGSWRTRTSGKQVAMASACSLRLDGEAVAPGTPSPPSPFKSVWSWRTHSGQVMCFERMVGVARSDMPTDDLDATVQGTLEASCRLGWRGVLEAHAASWAGRWRRSDVVVDGDPAAQQALRFAGYHLNGAANPDDERVSIAARGLTGSDYMGHVFWDTEIYLLPFYSLTWPEAARALLMYRFNTLDAARAKAVGMGWRGAMFAWESADTGAETTPEQAIGPDRKVVQILCGKQEQHITADVAYAVWQYWLASGDEAFLRDAGAEILLEAGRFWASRAGSEADGLHHIRGVTGPDEYHETVDDNAFTNVMARWSIRRAIETAALMRERWPDVWRRLAASLKLDDHELQLWSAVADGIVTGLAQSGLYEQFDGYFGLEQIDLADYAGRSVPMDVVLGRERTEKSQVVKQADVVALLGLLPEEFAGGTGAQNFTYYEPRCSHGSSLSRAMHGLVAARLGQSELALRFFRDTAAIDLADTHVSSDGGVHIAALGGVWMIAVLGFAGLKVLPDGMALNPQLPADWTTLTFRCQWRGRYLQIHVDQSRKKLVAVLEAGKPMTLVVQGKLHDLCSDKPLKLDLGRRGESEG
jgi:trehalose/maltose hydrolase-like predicted phosphorylase